MTASKISSIVGLIFCLIGSIFLVYGLIISKKDALNLGVTKWSGSTDEENLKLPQVKDRLKQSKNAIIGIVFIILGTSLQILGQLI